MPRVLLVDPDVEALGEVASALRSRGFAVANAVDAYEAVEAAYRSAPDAVLVVSTLDKDGELTQALRLIPQLQHLPVLKLQEKRDPGGRRVRGMPSDDLEVVVTRLLEACPRGSQPEVASDELRGNLSQMGLADLLQMLAMNKRSGTVTVTLPGGNGDIRVEDGEIVDAAYRRLEGEKALFRLLREASGHFTFNPLRASGPRRITAAGHGLLMDGMRLADEIRELRRKLRSDGVAFVAPKSAVDEPPVSSPTSGPVSGSGEIPSGALLEDVLRRLRAPRTIDELLDEVQASDLAILEAVALLEGSGRVRRIALGDLAARIAPEGGIAALRPLVARLAHPASATPRLVVATPPRKLSLLAATLQRLVEVTAAAEAPPRIDVARRLGLLRLGDGVEIELIGLPAHDALAPTWPLALAGAFVVVRLGQAGGAVLKAHCEELEVRLLEADALVGPVEPTEPERVATLIRRALEVSAGL